MRTSFTWDKRRRSATYPSQDWSRHLTLPDPPEWAIREPTLAHLSIRFDTLRYAVAGRSASARWSPFLRPTPRLHRAPVAPDALAADPPVACIPGRAVRPTSA